MSNYNHYRVVVEDAEGSCPLQLKLTIGERVTLFADFEDALNSAIHTLVHMRDNDFDLEAIPIDPSSPALLSWYGFASVGEEDATLYVEVQRVDGPMPDPKHLQTA